MSRTRLVVLISGSGTLLQALLDAAADPHYPAEVVAVVADTHAATGLQRARAAGVPAVPVPLAEHVDRAAWDLALRDAIESFEPDWVVSAGFMRLLGPAVLSAFPLRVVNTHPALLPSFPGAHAVRDALAHGVRVTGSTIHLVDEGVDTGPIIDQRAVEVDPDDDEASLHERIKVVERALLVDVARRLATHNVHVSGRKVTLT
ncbi:MAG TPA: phosphoribosylglycinamide formyltransferase [Candidatus Nanopelagicales bacterium]